VHGTPEFLILNPKTPFKVDYFSLSAMHQISLRLVLFLGISASKIFLFRLEPFAFPF
jgi:hypothetical protein